LSAEADKAEMNCLKKVLIKGLDEMGLEENEIESMICEI
jgi:hypothetical protein